MEFKDIINQWPSPAELARELTEETGDTISAYIVANWKVRDNIPSRYWKHLILISRKNGYSITAELLIDLAGKKTS